MTVWILLALVSVAIAALVAWALPAWTVKRILAAVEGDTVPVAIPGRGVPVLGLVWLVWAVGVATASALVGLLLLKVDAIFLMLGAEPAAWRASLDYTPLINSFVVAPLLLVAGAFGLGLAHDAFGGSSGDTGRWRALRTGRLTTGLLKLLGVCGLAFVAAGQVANSVARVDALVRDATGWQQNAYVLLTWIAATLVIALTARLVDRSNATPGRAVKVYSVLAVVGAGLSSWGLYLTMDRAMVQSVVNVSVGGAEQAIAGLPVGAEVWVWLAGVIVSVLAIVLGPALAAWTQERAGRATLGSAGSLAMGALAGYLLARSAPLWLLGVFVLVLVALRLFAGAGSSKATSAPPASAAGESVSVGNGDEGTWAGGPAAEDDDARRDDVS